VSFCIWRLWSYRDFKMITFARKLGLNCVHCRQHATLFWTIEMHAVNCFSQTSSVDIYRLHVSNDTWQHLTTEWDSYTWRSLDNVLSSPWWRRGGIASTGGKLPKHATCLYLIWESRAVARKPRDAAAVLFGLKFADNIHYKFRSSHA